MVGKAVLGMGSQHDVSRNRLELESEECPGACSPLDSKMVRTYDQGIATTYTIREFVRIELAKAFAWFLLFDFCWYQLSISQYNSSPPPDIFSDTLPNQALFGLSTGIMSYCTLSLQFSVFAALTVAIGMYSPQDWPPLMGRLRDVSTVRNFWGKFWHQDLRRVRSMS